jgi:hypothetical protein
MPAKGQSKQHRGCIADVGARARQTASRMIAQVQSKPHRECPRKAKQATSRMPAQGQSKPHG